MSVSVIIATYGDLAFWDDYIKRAYYSVKSQTVKPDEIIQYHGKTLASARNEAIQKATSEWIVILDADDELSPDYIEKMLKAKGDIRFPRVKKVWNDGSIQLISYPKGDIFQTNYCCIGSMFRKEDFVRAGMFGELPPIFEDWELFLRLYINGAEPEPSEATYIYHQRENSRNKQYDIVGEWYNEIRDRYIPMAKAAGRYK